MADAGVKIELRLVRKPRARPRDDLAKKLEDGLEEAADTTVPKIAAAARTQLPRGGGLADLIAATPARVTTDRSGDTVHAKISHPAAGIDRGYVDHPVYGTDEIVRQPVQPGFFSKTVEQAIQDVGRAKLAEAMREHARRI